MKLFLLSLILVIYFNAAHSQTANNTASNNDKNIYYQALTEYIDFQKWERGVTLDTIYILDDSRVADSLLQECGQTKLIKLKTADIQHYLKEHKTLILYKVLPLRFEDGEFSISFVPHLVSREKKKRDLNDNSISYRVVYAFDNDKFVFQRVEDYGI